MSTVDINMIDNNTHIYKIYSTATHLSTLFPFPPPSPCLAAPSHDVSPLSSQQGTRTSQISISRIDQHIQRAIDPFLVDIRVVVPYLHVTEKHPRGSSIFTVPSHQAYPYTGLPQALT
jgi:hypothetical protein